MTESKAGPKADPTISAAKRALADAIKGVDIKKDGGVADLCRLCDSLAKLKGVENKDEDGAYGSAL